MWTKIALAGLGAGLLTSLANAQSAPGGPSDEDRSRWNLGLNVSFINAELEVVSTEEDIPEDFVLEDATLDLSGVQLQARTAAISGSYFILPFLEVSGLAGVISSETDADLLLEGNLNSNFEALNGPVSLQLNNSDEIDGFVYGAGVHAYLPLIRTPSDTLVVRSGGTWARNQYNSEDLETFSYNLSSSLIYLTQIADTNYAFNLGVGYQFIDREVDRRVELGGETVTVRLNQELVDPWAIHFGAGVELTDTITLSYGSSYNLGGEVSHLFRLGWSH